jgi:hypothetical protein
VGNIRQVYEAYCDKCGKVERLGPCPDGNTAGALAMLRGWGWNQKDGYFCQACNGYKRSAVTFSSVAG